MPESPQPGSGGPEPADSRGPSGAEPVPPDPAPPAPDGTGGSAGTSGAPEGGPAGAPAGPVPGTPGRRRLALSGRWTALLGTGLLGLLLLAAVLALVSGGGDSGAAGAAAPAAPVSRPFGDCRTCHGDLDAVFARADLKGQQFRHAVHFEKVTSDCAVCHVAQPHSATGTVKPGHERCFACHGTGTATIVRSGPVIAPGACVTCHAPGTIPKPQTHTSPAWLSALHGRQATAADTRATCANCHTEQSCTSCHGVPMPHPSGFSGNGHVALAASAGAALCQRCHGGGAPTAAGAVRAAPVCESCHHPMKPATVSMRSFHPEYMEHRSTAPCAQCHTVATFCTRCHGREGGD